MRVAILTSDSREVIRDYSSRTVALGAAVTSLIQGFTLLNELNNSSFGISPKRVTCESKANNELTLPTNLEIHIVTCTQKRMQSPDKIAPNIWFHSLYVPKFGWLRTGYQGCVRAVRKKLKEIQPDIVHGQGTERDCAISAVFSGFKNVVTLHGNMAELARLFKAPIGSYGWLTAKLENLTLPLTVGVLCNSSYTESMVSKRAKKTWRVSNPIRASFFKPSSRFGKNAKPIILNIGNISPRKRQVETLEMMKTLNEHGYEFEVRFIGSCTANQYARRFLQKIDEVAHLGYAHYMGSINEVDLVTTMDKADALCHFPSEEAFGLVVAEALSRNLKVFGSSTGGILDITNGIEGVELFDADDWSSIRCAVSNWILSGYPHLVRANLTMEERYHPQVIAARHVEIYNEVLGI